VNCRELIDFLGDYLQRELPPEQQAEFERHLAACTACANYLRTYQATVRLGKAALSPTEDEAPAEVPEELLRAVLAARRQRPT